MSPRTFAVPLAALAISLNNGCTDNIVGEWELVELDGEDMPYEDSYTEDGITYTIRAEGRLTIDKDLNAEFEIEVSYVAEDDGDVIDSYDETYSYEGEVTPSKTRGKYEIELEGDDSDFEFDCTLSDGALSCDDDDLDELVFERDD